MSTPSLLPEPPLTGREIGDGDAALATELSALVGGDRVRRDAAARSELARDLWPRALLWLEEDRIPAPPDVVVRPARVDDVRAVIDWARRRGVAVVPHGAGSGVCGGSLHLRGGIALDLRGLDRVTRIDSELLEVEAEAGVLGTELEKALGEKGLTLGHFPSSIGLSSVGGWLATRSAGQCSSRYGKIEDLALGMEVVLGTGETLRLERPACGADPMELFLGSEGTLGAITSARLRLHHAPEVQLARGFRFRSIAEGLESMRDLFRGGLRPSVVRLYDPFDTFLALGPHGSGGGAAEPVPAPGRAELLTAREKGGAPRRGPKKKLLQLLLGRPLPLSVAVGALRSCLLVLVHEGPGEETRAEAMRARAICNGNGGVDLGEGPGLRWLRKRYAVSYEMPRMFDAGLWVDTFEVAAPWSGLLALHRAVREAVRHTAFSMAHFSHAYPDGCSIYFTFAGEGRDAYDATWSAALDAALAAGATITHHHGVGLMKGPWFRAELGEGIALLRGAKAVCDPAGIMNPGHLV